MISGRSGFLAKALLAAYLLSAALLPLTHHDVICHAKSSTHCTTCLATGSGEATPHAGAAEGAGLIDAGYVNSGVAVFVHAAPATASAGRSPPERS
ncbi:MAG TPA: hypothetical protein VFJ02_10930 [Vicinamibacterales bacterium]|nr:hypothetical protein [Vicinamibacterales bacterium]